MFQILLTRFTATKLMTRRSVDSAIRLRQSYFSGDCVFCALTTFRTGWRPADCKLNSSRVRSPMVWVISTSSAKSIWCGSRKQHIITSVVRACFAALRQIIRSVQRSTTREALLTLIRVHWLWYAGLLLLGACKRLRLSQIKSNQVRIFSVARITVVITKSTIAKSMCA